MVRNYLSEFLSFVRFCYRHTEGERVLLVVFIGLSLLAALTEGIGVTMLVPILENQSGPSMFSAIPGLGLVSDFFKGMDVVTKLQTVAMVLAGILLLRGILLFFVEALNGVIPLKLQRNLFLRGYESLLFSEFSYFTEKTTGDHTNSIQDWAVRVSNVLTNFGRVTYNVILFVVYLALMLTLSWKLAVVAGVFAVGMSVLLKAFTVKVLRRGGMKLSDRAANVSEQIFETISGMKFIKTSAAERKMRDRYTYTLGQKTDTNIFLVIMQAITHPALSTFAGLFICVLLFAGPYINEGNADQWTGGLLMFLFLLMRLLAPVSAISASRAQIASHIFVVNKMAEFFEETETRKQKSGTIPFTGLKREITFDGVKFEYPNSSGRAIHDLSIKIPAGKMVAIVGPSGSGKTTLVSLLLRFYDPQSGRILIDDTNLVDMDIYDLRQKVSVVSQDIFVFNDTVSNNLRFAMDGVPQDDIVQAAKLAAADEFIDALPEGYDTRLGDRGVRLSGGQLQRIAIARAIIRDPELLILDEATSHLDAVTEKAIQDAVEVLRSGRTVLVIAHRLSTIRRADVVIVVKNGQIVEHGTHTDLMAAKGLYWDMINHQNLDLVDEEETALACFEPQPGNVSS